MEVRLENEAATPDHKGSALGEFRTKIFYMVISM
jgi:hypothetical protein